LYIAYNNLEVNIMKNKDRKIVSKAQKMADSATQAFISEKSLETDPQGSYTGYPKDPNEVPTQDADDL